MRNVLPVVVSLCQEEQENIPPPSMPLQTLTPEIKCEQDHKQSIDECLVSISKQNSLVNVDAFPILQQLPSPPQDPTDNTQIIENKPPLTIKEGTKWCQRCGTMETPRWRFGPAGPSTLCNACHLRWKARDKPTEGYSSSVYPPPHHNPSSLKRYKSQTNKGTLKKAKKVKTTKKNDQERTITDAVTKPIPVIKPGLCCTHCNTSNTPLWRKGPFGTKTLCNACGLKWAKNIELLTVNKSVTKQSSFTSAATCIATMAKVPDNRRSIQTKKIPSSALLHYKKEYIEHGLYYDETRVNAKNQPFAFILPIHQGEFIISKQIDFELPADIHQERELGLIKSLQADRQPAFTRIRSNIFVERKPLSGNDAVICHCVRPSPDSNKVGCGDDCLNRMLFYECESKYCPCGDLCSNQRFQRKQRKKELQVFQTGNRGWGLRTLIDIKKGELVIEYRGEIISHELCEERMCTTYVNEKNFYFLDYCNGEVIDACTKGTEARFINHSCDPNCHIEKWSLKGESHFGVFASKDISAHSELFYDYNFSTFNGTVESQQICYCGSVCCRGTIGKKISGRSRKDV